MIRLACTLSLLVLVSHAAAAEAIPATRPAKDQDEAIKLAKEEDLPALKLADRVVVQAEGSKFLGGVQIDDGKFIDELRGLLTVDKAPPSGGETVYAMTFLRGKEVVRVVWIYPNGEWGFNRPKPPHWTIGANPELIKVIRERVVGRQERR